MSDSSATPGLLSSAEYERRKVFLDGLKGLTKSEYIEIVRILQRHEAPYSENDNGIFFNVASVPQPVFDALELFMNFTHMNRKHLAERELYMSTLKPTSKPADVVVENNV